VDAGGFARTEKIMHVFHIRYRNTQGTLMRILTAASRRGIDLPYVQAEPAEHTHKVTLLLEVNPKQVGQLCRDWRAVVDVIDVRAGAPLREACDHAPAWAAPHPAASVPAQASRQASA
jgi:acetolactate synthase regulatory subunit